PTHTSCVPYTTLFRSFPPPLLTAYVIPLTSPLPPCSPVIPPTRFSSTPTAPSRPRWSSTPASPNSKAVTSCCFATTTAPGACPSSTAPISVSLNPTTASSGPSAPNPCSTRNAPARPCAI